jgi:7-carboxy-7-deazaguanine synthase
LVEPLSELINHFDFIAMDLKLPSSTKCKPYWKEHEEFLKIAINKEVFVKSIVSIDTKVEDILMAAKLVAQINANLFFVIQPNYFDLDKDVMKKCEEFAVRCSVHLSNVQVMKQMHKEIGVR